MPTAFQAKHRQWNNSMLNPFVLPQNRIS